MEPLQTMGWGGGHTVILLYADDYTHTQVYHSSAPSGPLRIAAVKHSPL